MTWTLRPFRETDAQGCVAVFLDAVHNGTAPHYTAEEREAWAPRNQDHDYGDWTDRVASGKTFVAEEGTRLLGFATLAEEDPETGHLDFLYVRSDARNLGVSAALHDQIVDTAQSLGYKSLTTNASHLARSFLEKRGWDVTTKEVTLRNGLQLTRFQMRFVVS